MSARAVNGAALVVLVGVLWVLLGLVHNAIVLKVDPQISFAPATIYPQMRVHRDAKNREVVFGIYGDDFAQQSTAKIEGENGPYLIAPLPWKGVPRGEYVARATLVDNTGSIVDTALATITVK